MVRRAGGGGTARPGASGGWPLVRGALRPERWTIAAGVCWGLIWTAAKVSVPTLTGRAIDEGVDRQVPGALLRWMLATLGVGAVIALSTGMRRYRAFSVAYRVETSLRQRLFAHLQRLHFAYHDQASTGALMARAATDLQQVNGATVMIPISIANGLTVLATTVLLVRIDLRLSLLALGALPCINLIATRFSRRLHPVAMELQGELATLSSTVEETVVGIRAVKGFGAEALFAERMRVRAAAVFDAAQRAARVRADHLPLLELLPSLSLVAVIWYGGHLVLDGRLTTGQLVAFYAYVLLLITPLRMVGTVVAQVQRAVASAGRIAEVLATEPAIVDRPGARALPEGGGELRFEGVSFSYDDGTAVLTGLDLALRAGESVALVGATGSGKSTVAKLVPRFYDVTAGRVLLDGVDVRDLRLAELRRAVGIVFEDTFLFSDTIRANIAFADPGVDDAAVDRAARLAGVADVVAALPDGDATTIGERGFSLSGGQRQRIALARAIIADPRILILDDATSAVDPTKEHEIRGALLEVMRGRTTLVIAHRPATIALADRVVLLGEGRVLADGTHAQLLATSPAYRAVLARQEAAGGEAAAAPAEVDA